MDRGQVESRLMPACNSDYTCKSNCCGFTFTFQAHMEHKRHTGTEHHLQWMEDVQHTRTPPSSILAQWIFLITFVLVRVIEFSVSVRTTYTLMIILSQQHCPLDMMMSAIRFNWTSLPECSAAVRMSTRGCGADDDDSHGINLLHYASTYARQFHLSEINVAA